MTEATVDLKHRASQISLERRLAVVTGARRGIGLAIADALAHAGADVVGVSAALEPDGGVGRQTSPASSWPPRTAMPVTIRGCQRPSEVARRGSPRHRAADQASNERALSEREHDRHRDEFDDHRERLRGAPSKLAESDLDRILR
jgi:2-deoxy-D-gluconate 3-dehydrogenase